MRTAALFAFAGLLLAIALAIAWVLGITLFFPDSRLASALVIRADIIRAHIDYLMMAQFLFLFAVMLRHFAIEPPIWVVAACCYGAFFNPLAFVLRGLTPKAPPPAVPVEPYLPVPAAISFTATTLGFLAVAFLVTRAAWAARR